MASKRTRSPFLHGDRWTMPEKAPRGRREIVLPLHRTPKYEVMAYDFANRDEAAAVAREGRTPTRPPYRWSQESRAAKRKRRDA